MQKRLETDSSLSQFVGQFVPLKVISKGDQWQQWTRKYKREGSGIPIIYVVRADGEQLYGKSGALSGDALPQMLASVSQQSGRVLSESESRLLEECNEAAESALSQDVYLEAAAALAPVAKIGTLGALQSYAAPAIKSDELANTVLEQSQSALNEVEEKLDDPATVFDAVVELTKIREFGSAFVEIKQTSNMLLKKVSRDKVQRELLKPAKALVKARQDAQLPKASDRKRAERAYGLILKKFGDTPAASIAREELAGINPNSEFLSMESEMSSAEETGDGGVQGYDKEKVRTWSNSTGKFTIDAKLIEATDEFVRLRKEDGKEIKVPLSKLDDAAKKYLDSRQ